MVSYTELVNKPIKVQGKEVILVLDDITDELEGSGEGYSSISEATSGRPEVYVSETKLKSIREQFPRIPVYGFWHTLYQSGILNPEIELQVVPEDNANGVFVRHDVEQNRVLLTGTYSDGIFRGAGDLMLTDAVPIQVDVEKLKLPSDQAFLVKELSGMRDRVRKLRFMVLGGILLLILGTAAFVDHYYKSGFDAKMTEYRKNKKSLQKLEKEINALAKKKLLYPPENESFVNKVFQLTLLDPELSIERQSFEGNYIKVKLSNQVQLDPAKVYAWADTRVLAEGGWEVRVPFSAYQWEGKP